MQSRVPPRSLPSSHEGSLPRHPPAAPRATLGRPGCGFAAGGLGTASGGRTGTARLAVEQCRPFEDGLFRFVENAHPALLATIREKKALDDGLKGQMTSAIKEFKTKFLQEQKSK